MSRQSNNKKAKNKEDEEQFRLSTEALLKTGLGMRKRTETVVNVPQQDTERVTTTEYTDGVLADNMSDHSGQEDPEPLEEILTDPNENRRVTRLSERMKKLTTHHDDWRETKDALDKLLKELADRNFSSVVNITRVADKEKT